MVPNRGKNFGGGLPVVLVILFVLVVKVLRSGRRGAVSPFVVLRWHTHVTSAAT